MFREKVPQPQLNAWLFAAMTPPLIQILGGASWLTVLLVGVGCTAIGCLLMKRKNIPEYSWLRGLQGGAALLLLSEILKWTAGIWPGGNTEPAVPLILLALAAWSARRGPANASKVGSVLFWFVLLLYLAVFAAGVKEVETRWLVPTIRLPEAAGMLVFLLPAAASVLPREGKDRQGKIWLSLLFALTAAVLTNGVLSAKVAGMTDKAFYEMSRSLSLPGLGGRFEALVCAGMTVGWFALMSLLLSLCAAAADALKTGWGKRGLWMSAAVAAGWHLCGLHIPWQLTVSFCTVFWVFFPVLTQEIVKIKKSEKNEKSA